MTDAPPSDASSFGRRAEPPVEPEPRTAIETQPAPPVASRPAAVPTAETTTDTPLVPGPRRSRQSRNQVVVFLNFVLTCITVVVIAAGVVLYYGKSSFEAPGPFAADATFTVEPKSGVGKIADQLERRGLITDSRVFQAGVRASGRGGELKAGEYAIPAHASMRAIMDVIRSGKTILYSLTIPEGLTVDQAFGRIAAQPELAGDMPATPPAEGSLAADTQRFARNTPRRQIIDKMMDEQRKLVDEIWNRRAPDLPLADKDEFLTLASIVEKETGLDAERPHVAAVFLNRLAKKMRLQSDPTIIYGLFGGKGKPADRPILKSDIDKPTPYNTYLIKGLPPTPIANPGRAALEAVANPTDTKDLYFVADGSGGHVFASTLAEHNRNVARWRAIQEERARADAGADAGTEGSIVAPAEPQ